MGSVIAVWSVVISSTTPVCTEVVPIATVPNEPIPEVVSDVPVAAPILPEKPTSPDDALRVLASAVATPVPQPVVPAMGRPVPLLSVTADGVPKLGVVITQLVVIHTLTVPLTAYSPATPALSNRTLVVVPPVIVVEPTAIVAAPAVMVLQPHPVPVVHIRALDAPEHDGIDRAVGAPSVMAPSVVLAAMFTMPVSGRPDTLVRVPPDGVPRAPPLTRNAPIEPVLIARAAATPVPGVMLVPHAVPVLTAIPAPG